MTSKTKITLLFLPLLLLITGVLVFGWDLKNPTINETDSCAIVSYGPEVTKENRKLVYGQGGDNLYDIAINCDKNGPLMINDPEAFRQSVIETGLKVQLIHKKYALSPEKWHFSVYPKEYIETN